MGPKGPPGSNIGPNWPPELQKAVSPMSPVVVFGAQIPSKTAFKFGALFGVVFLSFWGRFLDQKCVQNGSRNDFRQRARAKNPETRNRPTSQCFLQSFTLHLATKRSQNEPKRMPEGFQKRGPKNDAKNL